MSISSAHPDRLATYATDVGTSLGGAVEAARRGEAAFQRYLASCPDAAGAPGAAPLTARLALDALGSHASAVSTVGAAFAAADRDHGDLAARLDDVELSRRLVEHHPGIATGLLLAPLHQLEAAGAAVGRDLADAIAAGDLHGAGRLLIPLAADGPPDETFAAALVNELGHEALSDLTEGLALLGPDPWARPNLGLATLAALTTAATRTWDGSRRGITTLDRSLVLALTETAAGRSTLRALSGVPGHRPGRRFLTLVVGPLLARSGAATDTGTPLAAYLERNGVSPDQVLLERVAADRDLSLHLLTGNGADVMASIHARVTDPDGRAALAAVVATALDHPELGTPAGAGTRRVLVLGLATTLDQDPRAVDADLARMAAETLITDPETWTALASGRTDGDVSRPFEAIARHDESVVTAIAGIDLHERRVLADLAEGARPIDGRAPRPDPRYLVTDLVRLDELLADLHRGAEAADVPNDDWAWLAAGGHWTADRALELARADRRAQLVSSAVAPIVRRAVDGAHAASRGRPGTSADRLEDQRARRRRHAWVAIAEHPRFAGDLVWDVAGSSIASPGDLLDLGVDVAANADLEAWARAQPADLATWAEEQVLTLDRIGG